MLPERQRTPNQVFPKAALRLVDRQRGASLHTGAFQFGGNALAIQGMSAFVHGAEEHWTKEIRIQAGGDAHIIDAEFGGKWMRGLILAAAFPIVTEPGDDFHAETPLFGLIEGLVQE